MADSPRQTCHGTKRRTEKKPAPVPKRLPSPRAAFVPTHGPSWPFLEALIAPGDRVVLEGNNQKAGGLSVAPRWRRSTRPRVNGLHMVIPSVSSYRTSSDLFERGIARKARLLVRRCAKPAHLAVPRRRASRDWRHSHLHRAVYARLYVDLTPNVVLVAGFPGRFAPATSTPVQALKTPQPWLRRPTFRDGIVIAQVNEIVDDVRRPAARRTSRAPGSTLS